MKLLPASALLVVAASTSAAQCPTETISGSLFGSAFGTSFDIDHGRVLAAAPGTSFGWFFQSIGEAYLFEATENGLEVTEEFLAPTSIAGASFGSNVVLRGDEAMISAHGQESGRVHVYRRDGSDWVLRQSLTGSDTAYFAGFGVGLDVDGDRAVIGAWNASTTGAAFIFEREPNGDWIEVDRLTPSGPQQDRVFGGAVAIQGDRVLIGAQMSGDSLPGAGAVYVFDEQGPGNWVQTQRLTGSGAADEDAFGWAIGFEGDVAAITAIAHEDGTKGAVYVFENENGQLVEREKMMNPLPTEARYGHTPSIHGDRIAVGAVDNGLSGGTTNYVHFIERIAGQWTSGEVMHGALGTGFGAAVELGEHGLAVGVSKGFSSLNEVRLFALDDQITMTAGPGEASASAGAQQTMRIAACPDLAGEPYLVVGSITGTTPTIVDEISVPLTPDAYTVLTATNPTATLSNGVGVLDAEGRALVELQLPAVPAFAGLEVFHAALLFEDGNPIESSNASRLVLLP